MNNVVVDTKEIELFASKLKTLPKQAFPSAVRNTLNSLAFDVKQRSLPISARKNFVNRSPNFFKANSAVKKANGFNVQTMHSIVGMSEDKLKNKSTNYAVKDLEQQEHGGTIKSKTFIGMNPSRVGNSWNKVVRRQLSIDEIADKSIKTRSVNSRRNRGGKQVAVKSEKQKFVVALHVAKKGGFIMTENAIFRVNSLNKTKTGQFKLSKLYSKKTNRTVKVKATHFMDEAKYHTMKKVEKIFKENSEFQFQKHLKV